MEEDDAPVVRVDVYVGGRNEHFFSEQALVWKRWLAISIGERAYLVNLDDFRKYTFELNWYFLEFHPLDDCLLITSGERVFRIGPDGRPGWSSEPVAIDGIELKTISEATIEGAGEHDPPGDWRPFRLDRATGKVV